MQFARHAASAWQISAKTCLKKRRDAAAGSSCCGKISRSTLCLKRHQLRRFPRIAAHNSWICCIATEISPPPSTAPTKPGHSAPQTGSSVRPRRRGGGSGRKTSWLCTPRQQSGAPGHLQQEQLPAMQRMAARSRLVRISQRSLRAAHLVVRGLRLSIRDCGVFSGGGIKPRRVTGHCRRHHRRGG